MAGEPVQVQVSVPADEATTGVSVTVTDWPTDVVAVDPSTVMPLAPTAAEVTLPTNAMLQFVETASGTTVPPPAA